jgi:hypothetical protein
MVPQHDTFDRYVGLDLLAQRLAWAMHFIPAKKMLGGNQVMVRYDRA